MSSCFDCKFRKSRIEINKETVAYFCEAENEMIIFDNINFNWYILPVEDACIGKLQIFKCLAFQAKYKKVDKDIVDSIELKEKQ